MFRLFRLAGKTGPLRMPAAPNLFSRSLVTHNVLYMTDVEGTSFFFNSLKKNNIVKYDSQNGLYFNPQVKNPYFIYGGDVTDRGNYDLRLTKLFVDFKKKYPDQVKLLVGNREISKNRIKIELAPQLIRERLLHGKPARWIPMQQQTRPRDYVLTDMVSKLGITVKSNDLSSIDDYIHSLSIEQCQLIYLDWMLKETMGCPHAFRYRREELAKDSSKIITNEDVLNSFLKEASPAGLTGQYLQLAQVGVFMPGSGILAVHGGVTEANVGRVPDMPVSAKRIDDAELWISKFNDWYSKQIKHWIHLQPQELTEPACTKLDEITLPLAGQKKTIITADMLAEGRNVTSIVREVGSYMGRNQIKVVLTGHQPCGDFPVILRDDRMFHQSSESVLYINGDTGYSKFDPKNPDDSRGNACHAMELTSTADSVTVRINATLSSSDLQVEPISITVNSGNITGDDDIGSVFSDGRSVQCRLADGRYRLVKQEGFKVTYSVLTMDELNHLKLGKSLDWADLIYKNYSAY